MLSLVGVSQAKQKSPAKTYQLRKGRSTMNRAKLINKLVARKMQTKGNRRPFCICLAGTSRALCFGAAGKQPAAKR